MKTNEIVRRVVTLLVPCFLLLSSCDDFLDVAPTASLDEDEAFKNPEEMVVSAYSALGNCWYDGPFNLCEYGDMPSDDAFKGGGGLGDNPEYHLMELWSTLDDRNRFLDILWYQLHRALSRVNRAAAALTQHGDKLDANTLKQRRAEVKFLHAHFEYKLATVFGQIPWIDEAVYTAGSNDQQSNTQYTHNELLELMCAELEEAYEALPGEVAQDGRVNKIACAAFLAKINLDLAWGNGYEAATGVDHIDQAKMKQVEKWTAIVRDSKFGYLDDYGDLFLPEYDNNSESIFAVQHSDYEEDGTPEGRNNWSTVINGTWGIWSKGWDFHKPTQNLVNAYKTEQGLPVADAQAEDKWPDMAAPDAQKWDPRLFHTVGMPSWPYKYDPNLVMTTDNSRTPSDYGHYTSLKEVPQYPGVANESMHDGTWQHFSNNEYVFRYTDVMLMRAEALIELGELDEAEGIVNDIRDRAARSVSKHIGYAAGWCDVKPYPTGYFSSKEIARQAYRTERRLEMGMENRRYFDLRRWGIASTTLDKFYHDDIDSHFSGLNSLGEVVNTTYAGYLKDAKYTTNKNEFWPIPNPQMLYVPGLYTQNPGY